MGRREVRPLVKELGLTATGVGTGRVGLPITDHQLGFRAPNGGIFEAYRAGDLTTPNAGLTFSGNTHYDFGGALKNFSAGAACNWQQKIRQGYATFAGVREVYYAPDAFSADLRFGYRFRRDRVTWRLQFTIQNFLDEQPVVKNLDTTTGALNTVNVLQPPRTFSLTATMRF